MASALNDVFASARHTRRRMPCSRGGPASCPGPKASFPSPVALSGSSISSSDWSAYFSPRHSNLHTAVFSKRSPSSFLTSSATASSSRGIYSPSTPPKAVPTDTALPTHCWLAVSPPLPIGSAHCCASASAPVCLQTRSVSRLSFCSRPSLTLPPSPSCVRPVSSLPFFLPHPSSSLQGTGRNVLCRPAGPKGTKARRSKLGPKRATPVWADSHDQSRGSCREPGPSSFRYDSLERCTGCPQVTPCVRPPGSPRSSRNLSSARLSTKVVSPVASATSPLFPVHASGPATVSARSLHSCSCGAPSSTSALVLSSYSFLLSPSFPSAFQPSAPASSSGPSSFSVSASFGDICRNPPRSFPSGGFGAAFWRPAPPRSSSSSSPLAVDSLCFFASEPRSSLPGGDRRKEDASSTGRTGDFREGREGQANSPDVPEAASTNAGASVAGCPPPHEKQSPSLAAAGGSGESEIEFVAGRHSADETRRSDGASSFASFCSPPPSSEPPRFSSAPHRLSPRHLGDSDPSSTLPDQSSFSQHPPGPLELQQEDTTAWNHLLDDLLLPASPHLKDSSPEGHAGVSERLHRHRSPGSPAALSPHFGPPLYRASFSPPISYFPPSSAFPSSHSSPSPASFSPSSSFPLSRGPSLASRASSPGRVPIHASRAEGAAVAAAAAAAAARRMAAVAEALEWTEEVNRLFAGDRKDRGTQAIGRTGISARCSRDPSGRHPAEPPDHALRHIAPAHLVRSPASTPPSPLPRGLYMNHQFPVLANAALKGLYDRLFRSRKQTLPFSKRKRTGVSRHREWDLRRGALRASCSTLPDAPLLLRTCQSESGRRDRVFSSGAWRDHQRSAAPRISGKGIGRRPKNKRRVGWTESPAGEASSTALAHAAPRPLPAEFHSPGAPRADASSATDLSSASVRLSGEKTDTTSPVSEEGEQGQSQDTSRDKKAAEASSSVAAAVSHRAVSPKKEDILKEAREETRGDEAFVRMVDADPQTPERDRARCVGSLGDLEKGRTVASRPLPGKMQRDGCVSAESKPARAEGTALGEPGDSARDLIVGRDASGASQVLVTEPPEAGAPVRSVRMQREPAKRGDQITGEVSAEHGSGKEGRGASHSVSSSMVGGEQRANAETAWERLETHGPSDDRNATQAPKGERTRQKSSLSDALGSRLQEGLPGTPDEVERAAETFQEPVAAAASPSFPPTKPPEIAPAFPFVAEETVKPAKLDGRCSTNLLVLAKTAESVERRLSSEDVWTCLTRLASSLSDQIRNLVFASASELDGRWSGASPFFQRVYGNAGTHFSLLRSRLSEWCYQNGNVLVTMGSVLSLTGTVMADMRLLRGFNLLAGICFFSYNYTRRPSMTDAAAWNVVFFSLNFFMLYRYLTEHNEVGFTNDELDVFEKYFLPAGLSPRRFRTLLSVGQWETLPAGTEIARPGEPAKKLLFILRGRVDVYQHGDLLEHYNGSDGAPVVGLEAFLSYVSALRRLAALGEATKKSKASTGAPGASGSDPSPTSSPVTVAGSPQAVGVVQTPSGDGGQGSARAEDTEPPTALREYSATGGPAETPAYTAVLSRGTGGNGTPASREGAEGGAGIEAETRREEKEGADEGNAEGLGLRGTQSSVLPLSSDPTGSLPTPDDPQQGEKGSRGTGEGAFTRDLGTGRGGSDARVPEALGSEAPSGAAWAMPTRGLNVPEGPGEKEEEEEEEGLLLPPLQEREDPASTKTGAPEAAEGPAAHTRASYFHEAAVVSEEEEDEEEEEAIWSRFLRSGRRRSPRGMLREEEARSTQEKEIAESLESGRASDKRAVCVTDCDVLVFDIETAARFILDDPVKVGFPVLQGLTSVLVERAYAQSLRLAVNNYDSVVAGVLADGAVQTEERSFLQEWRARRGISEAQHIEALRRCGWSLEEFERGERHRSDGGFAGTVGRALYSVLTLSFLRNGGRAADGSPSGGGGEKEAQTPVGSDGEKKEEKLVDATGGTTALLGSRLEASWTGAEKKGEGAQGAHGLVQQDNEADKRTSSSDSGEKGSLHSRLRAGTQPGPAASPSEADRETGGAPGDRKTAECFEEGSPTHSRNYLSRKTETTPIDRRAVDGSGGYTA
ncbi:conserved hypothetical protein [Neospora caninum Liverpool]|uniref:Cyclic nucleotide-binding domain-containing protein n=1 Tax=Neospora caninum (strain Liverpool) TaxID=572307 RepID=F0VF63_NEOCL|nr:conserved hypothetical protein [Neospora caninum Liverpool]CBZ52357.1 conserved hypothetical protein [Neospora caninum Liverpool]CEL66327.1 TPA: hypothetical protein BN1204_021450 [Neospora caninum Liverpool]|eukprot:XP_003882389.1 conserved hypothetical protein [Neospora caninum Liverpool]